MRILDASPIRNTDYALSLMRLTDYERNVQRDIDRWERGAGDNLLTQALGFVMRPVDWIFDQFVPDSVVDTLTDALRRIVNLSI